MAKKLKSDDFIAQQIAKQIVMPRNLRGELREEYDNIVRHFASGKLTDRKATFKWCVENLGIRCSEGAFVRHLNRDVEKLNAKS